MRDRGIVFWTGEEIAGGEPAWFSELASNGQIERSAEGVGPCLLIKSKGKIIIVNPKSYLIKAADGTLTISQRIPIFLA